MNAQAKLTDKASESVMYGKMKFVPIGDNKHLMYGVTLHIKIASSGITIEAVADNEIVAVMNLDNAVELPHEVILSGFAMEISVTGG